MAFNVVGLVSIVVFYVLILLVGLWAARKGKKSEHEGESEDIMLAGRNIGLMVGVFTMTATWVGGGYINGTAEMIYRSGLVWCQAPIGYALSLILGGVLFAEKMRTEGYVTMLDPFCLRYGERMGGLLFLPALMGEIFWSAAILSALGATLTVILEIPDNVSIIVSACIAVFYTFFGGLYSVAYTDVVQLFCIFVGLWVCIPASMTAPPVESFSKTAPTWMGKLDDAPNILLWMDYMLLLTFGGIPWQVYFQRVLSSSSATRAKWLSYIAAVGCIIMAIPAILIGAVAKSTDWNQTDWVLPNGSKVNEIPEHYYRLVLPLVLQYLTPAWVAFIGLGAVSAAVMSSADSSIFSAASMFARNIWKLSIRRGASESEVIKVMRFSVIAVGIMATIMALLIDSIYELWFLCADLVYVVLFPQLLCVVYMRKANTYGSLSGYIVGLLLRFLGGEPSFGIKAFIEFPFYDPELKLQYFPFRTLSMVLSLGVLVSVSLLTDHLFTRAYLSPRYDFMQCVTNIPHDRFTLKESASLASSSNSLAMNYLQKQSVLHEQENGGKTNPLLLHPFYGVGGPDSTGSTPTSVSEKNSTNDNENVPLNNPQQQMLNYESMLKD